jgi:hypothetical protein
LLRKQLLLQHDMLRMWRIGHTPGNDRGPLAGRSDRRFRDDLSEADVREIALV